MRRRTLLASVRERPSVRDSAPRSTEVFFLYIIKRLRVARHNESIMKFVANSFSNRFYQFVVAALVDHEILINRFGLALKGYVLK